MIRNKNAGAYLKAAEDSRTPKPCGGSMAEDKAPAFGVRLSSAAFQQILTLRHRGASKPYGGSMAQDKAPAFGVRLSSAAFQQIPTLRLGGND